MNVFVCVREQTLEGHSWYWGNLLLAILLSSRALAIGIEISNIFTLIFGRSPARDNTILSIPDICHLDHLHVGGEEICHVEKFQISIHGISPHEEEFQFFHTTDVEKCEILPNLEEFHISPQDRCEEI